MTVVNLFYDSGFVFGFSSIRLILSFYKMKVFSIITLVFLLSGTVVMAQEGTGEIQKESQPVFPANYSIIEISKVAVFPGCEEFENEKNKLQICLVKELNEKMEKQLSDFKDYMKEAEIYRMSTKIQFVIDQDGRIVQIKNIDKNNRLGTEAVKALERISYDMITNGEIIKPAELVNGIKVKLVYTLPVVCVVQP